MEIMVLNSIKIPEYLYLCMINIRISTSKYVLVLSQPILENSIWRFLNLLTKYF